MFKQFHSVLFCMEHDKPSDTKLFARFEELAEWLTWHSGVDSLFRLFGYGCVEFVLMDSFDFFFN